MSASELHLIKVPLRADKLNAIAARRGLRARHLDEGYLVHCVLTELWQEFSPAPFMLKGRGRAVDVWGYSPVAADALVTRAVEFGDPQLLAAFDGIDSISSKIMPRFPVGRLVGFLTRVCPVVRLAKNSNGHKAGAEMDAYVAKLFATDDRRPSREEVYTSWFRDRLGDATTSGVEIVRLAISGMNRRRLLRRTQGVKREAHLLERPDVHIEGDLKIVDPEAWLRTLARGVGRHKAFGFGAILVVPPGTTHSVPHT